MRVRSVTWLLPLLALCLGGDRSAVAAPPPPPEPLSPAVQQKLAELRVAMTRKAAPLRAQLEVKQGELRLLWMATQPDRKAIMKKLAELSAAHDKLVEAQVDLDLAVLKLLTPAQRAMMAPPPGPPQPPPPGAGPCGPGGAPGMMPPPPLF